MDFEEGFDPATRRYRAQSDEILNELDELMLTIRAALLAVPLEPLPAAAQELFGAEPVFLDRTLTLLRTLEARLRESEAISLDLAARLGESESFNLELAEKFRRIETALWPHG